MNDMVICIGRQYGSGGREVGEKLAARLGVTCYDKLLLKQAAQKSGVSEKEFERLDEQPVSTSQFLSGNVFADSASIRAYAKDAVTRIAEGWSAERQIGQPF